MALRINTNVAALNAHKNMIKTNDELSNSLSRLSSGLRINKAADDASGMIIADSLKAQSLGLGQAIRNANDGISIVQTADGALQESINIVNTIKTKAIQAASDGQTSKTRTAIQNDINKLMEELDVIAQTTSFNGQKLLSGGFTNKSIQIGAYANETADISIASTESTKTGHITTSTLELQGDGGEVQLTITSALTGKDLKLNTIDIQSNNNAENGMGALADEINRYSSSTGISATAVVQSTTEGAIQAGTTGSDFAINGITIGSVKTSANDSNAELVTAINAKTAEHGVLASMEEDGRMTLTSTDGRAIKVTGGVDEVLSSTADQMSTIGHIELTQNGTSEISVNGVGAGATGVNVTVKGDYNTVEDSIIAAGSTIKAGTDLATGTTIGGELTIGSTVSSSQMAYEMKTGSTLGYGSDITKGTTLGGQITVGGDTDDSSFPTMDRVSIEQDMLVTEGSTLSKGSILGKGTVVTTAFSSYDVGDTLTAAVTLDNDLTLQADMNLKYSDTDNSGIAAGSTLSSGTVLGADFNDIGITYDGNVAAPTITDTNAIATAIKLSADLTTDTDGSTLESGSILKDGSELVLDTDTTDPTNHIYKGPDLITTNGTIKSGDQIDQGTTVTLAGDQKITGDIDLHGASGTSTIKSGSTLAKETVFGTVASGGAGNVATVQDTSLNKDMSLGIGSSLSGGSKLTAGSTLGDKTGVAEDITTYQKTDLKSGSSLSEESIMAKGSTIGGMLKITDTTALDSDMTVKKGSTLTTDTKLAAGTVINQDMSLKVGTTTTMVSAGSKLSEDMQLASDVTLTEDMTLKEGSEIKEDSEIAVNTANAGTVGLSETESYKLSDINVLTQEGAQRAIKIADAALESLDNTRASLGSTQNQLTSSISNLSTTKTNIMASESTIRDVDFAEESMNYGKLQLLGQTGSYAMAQANASSQNIMSLLK